MVTSWKGFHLEGSIELLPICQHQVRSGKGRKDHCEFLPKCIGPIEMVVEVKFLHDVVFLITGKGSKSFLICPFCLTLLFSSSFMTVRRRFRNFYICRLPIFKEHSDFVVGPLDQQVLSIEPNVSANYKAFSVLFLNCFNFLCCCRFKPSARVPPCTA